MADAPQIERGPADQTLVSGSQLPFGQAQTLNRIVAMRTQQAPAPSPPSAQATPPGSAAGSIPVTGTAAPEAPFRPTRDQEFTFGPTARPGESVMAGVHEALAGAPPEYASIHLQDLGGAASLTGEANVQALFTVLTNRLMAARQ